MNSTKILNLIIWTAFVGYTICLMYWMFIGFGRTSRNPLTPLTYNLMPLTTIKKYFLHYDHFQFRVWFINIFGNIGVFMPFGFFLPLLFRKGSQYGNFAIMFMLPLLFIEIMQTLLRRGSFDVDDLILNLLGASLGFLIFRSIRRRGEWK